MNRLRLLTGMVTLLFTATVAMADITIGVNLSTTGPAASLGIPEKNALAFAPKTIAGQNVKLVVYDDASDTTTAVQNTKRLVSENKVDLIIGSSTTPCSLAMVDVAAGAKTPMLSVASASAIVAPVDAKRKWAFKVSANDDIYAAAMVAHMVKKGVKSVGVIAVDDPYGESNTQEYVKLAKKYGIKTQSIEKFKKTDTSVTAQVLKLMSGKPDAMFIVAVGTPAALPHTALVERGYKGKIYQTGGAANADFLRVGGKALEGSFLPASPVLVAEQLPNGYPTKAEALKFAKAYEGKYGPRSTFASHIWDALKIVEAAVPKALKKAKPGTPEFRQALRDAIETTKGYNGAYAVFNMSPTDHSGVDQRGMSVIKIENGKWKLEDHAKF
ncbi:ABC transporter substrate-binding protein [Geomobilimonas luticola]|uniref:ABC transporter substrate-binding protein n=1 Tax=Geomobilimonas luticola TaxID=1114878 RepID=A0ABS5SDK2_9BACT|nr:ABC transporter substrate-binding protein [Geomobilimonas luticola]MBT0653453.1 ABC transporter substrate-binding protein [Geomobilimonas luticola]